MLSPFILGRTGNNQSVLDKQFFTYNSRRRMQTGGNRRNEKRTNIAMERRKRNTAFQRYGRGTDR